MSSTITRVFADALLGPPGRQRVRASQSLLGLVVYIASAATQQVEVMLGLMGQAESLWLSAFYLSGGVLFYIVIRSGLNERVPDDPALTLAQTVFGVVVVAGCYAVITPMRGVLLALQVMILAFAMFSLPPARSRGLAAFTVVLMAAVMAFKSHTDPARYPPVIESLHFYHACFVLTFITVLAGRMATMRARLKSQKRELELALERIGQLATHDELTGLFNRRHMITLLHDSQARQRRDGSAMAIAMLDIDHFKTVNDAHGHPAGDAVLQRFAQSATKVLRATDVLARWGGEKFLLMLPATSPEQALRTLERVRAGVSAASFDDIAAGLRVTFSAGLSGCRGDDLINACIERADQAMYRAKARGRDCALIG